MYLVLLTVFTSSLPVAGRGDTNNASLVKSIVSVAKIMVDKPFSPQQLAGYLGKDIRPNYAGYAYFFQTKSKQFDGGYLYNVSDAKGVHLWLELGVASKANLRIIDLARVLGSPVVVWRFDYEPEAKWVYRKQGISRYAVIYARMGGDDDKDQLPPDMTTQTYVITIKIKDASS